mmetsp:Transcript_75142/g.163932  ORF Transcript_75142/g.163932 Transcript_75142/m.163932 type:complete len:472 (+) Transcript_75142:39-1454(+)
MAATLPIPGWHGPLPQGGYFGSARTSTFGASRLDGSPNDSAQFSPSNDSAHHHPARKGLAKALENGRLRNPLEMQQSSFSSWSTSKRPPSAHLAVGTVTQNVLKVKDGSHSARTHGSSSALASSGVAIGSGGSGAPLHGLTAMTPASEKGPGVLHPQRIELPGFLNTPPRCPDNEVLRADEKTQTLQRIQDLQLLVFACRRAKKQREEGRAHFGLGVLRDNLGLYQKAINSYGDFLKICQECSDTQGSALAYHCIAVDYQLMGGGITSASEASDGVGQVKPNPNDQGPAGPVVKPDLLRKAITYHNKHRECADSVGKFVAHLNMGLAYAKLGEKESAVVNHQYALRYALQLRSLEGQSLAIGSLSFSAGMYENDPDKMRKLIERYIELCGALKQTRNQASALMKLGVLASEHGQSEESIQYFQQAIECARAQGDREAEKDCTVRLGIAAGQAKMADHLSGILQRSVIRTEP